MLIATLTATAADIFGQVSPPPGVAAYDTASGSLNFGLLLFVSNVIKLVVIIAGIFGLFNVIAAGYTILSSQGNPKALEGATSQLFMSFIGLAVIVGAFTITGIVSFILFGDATFILNPTIPSPI